MKFTPPSREKSGQKLCPQHKTIYTGDNNVRDIFCYANHGP